MLVDGDDTLLLAPSICAEPRPPRSLTCLHRQRALAALWLPLRHCEVTEILPRAAQTQMRQSCQHYHQLESTNPSPTASSAATPSPTPARPDPAPTATSTTSASQHGSLQTRAAPCVERRSRASCATLPARPSPTSSPRGRLSTSSLHHLPPRDSRLDTTIQTLRGVTDYHRCRYEEALVLAVDSVHHRTPFDHQHPVTPSAGGSRYIYITATQNTLA